MQSKLKSKQEKRGDDKQGVLSPWKDPDKDPDGEPPQKKKRYLRKAGRSPVKGDGASRSKTRYVVRGNTERTVSPVTSTSITITHSVDRSERKGQKDSDELAKKLANMCLHERCKALVVDKKTRKKRRCRNMPFPSGADFCKVHQRKANLDQQDDLDAGGQGAHKSDCGETQN